MRYVWLISFMVLSCGIFDKTNEQKTVPTIESDEMPPMTHLQKKIQLDMEKRGVTIWPLRDQFLPVQGYFLELERDTTDSVETVQIVCREFDIRGVGFNILSNKDTEILSVIYNHCKDLESLSITVKSDLENINLNEIRNMQLRAFYLYDVRSNSMKMAKPQLTNEVFDILSSMKLEFLACVYCEVSSKSLKSLTNSKNTLTYFGLYSADDWQSLTSELMNFSALTVVELLGSPSPLDYDKDGKILSEFKVNYMQKYGQRIQILHFGGDSF